MKSILIRRQFADDHGKTDKNLAIELNRANEANEFFFTGMFSAIDVLLNKPMDQVLEGLPLSNHIKDALLGEDNELRRTLNGIIESEMAHWDNMKDLYPLNVIGVERYMLHYLDSLKWAKELNY